MPAAAKPTAFETGKNLVGAGMNRVDGPLKVSGRAQYSYEYRPERQPLYGVAVESTIASGHIVSINTAEAEAAPGVVLVMTYQNAPKQAKWQEGGEHDRHGGAKPFLSTNTVRFYGEPVALVVADTFERATAAARLVRVSYQKNGGETDFRAALSRSEEPRAVGPGRKPNSIMGQPDVAFADAPVKLDEVYTTAQQNHSMMEPHASLADWEDGRLTIYAPVQLIVSAHHSIARTFNLGEDKVRVIARYIGGGFGGKLPTNADSILAAAAAIKLNRPVKVALTRQQMFHMTTNRTASVQHIRLGAERDGTLTLLEHTATTHTARFDDFAEPITPPTRSMYAAPNRRTDQHLVKLDLPISDSMRAPGEAISLLALESAMDELAVQLNMDPIELRKKNEPKEDPEKQVPFSSRHLVGCLEEGARRFGWRTRNPKPGSVRDGRQLVGMGVAAAIRGNYLRPAQARVRIYPNGNVRAQLAMTDLGTGSYTILTQIAAETLGIPVENVRVEIGDSTFPPTPGSGGSFGAASSGSALYDACMNLRKAIADYAVADEKSPLHGAKGEDVSFGEGRLSFQNRSDALVDVIGRNSPDGIEMEGSIKPGDEQNSYSHQAYGAHFVEVGVDMDTGEVRLRRMLGVFAAGRILNAKTARSQLIGGMIWGVSSALHEENIVDRRYGSFINQDLANYHVPVHADIGEVDAVILPEIEEHHNPLGIKGIGELGICGAGAAVANAIYNATGARVRDFPITLDKILPEMRQGA